MLPEWAAGFWQCKLRYRTQDELLAVAKDAGARLVFLEDRSALEDVLRSTFIDSMSPRDLESLILRREIAVVKEKRRKYYALLADYRQGSLGPGRAAGGVDGPPSAGSLSSGG